MTATSSGITIGNQPCTGKPWACVIARRCKQTCL